MENITAVKSLSSRAMVVSPHTLHARLSNEVHHTSTVVYAQLFLFAATHSNCFYDKNAVQAILAKLTLLFRERV